VTVGVVDGKVAYLSSSLTTDTRVTNEVVLSAEEAVRSAAQTPGQPAGSVSNAPSDNGWPVMDVAGYTDPARVCLIGVPTPTNGVRRAYEVLLMDVAGTDPLGAVSYIDAENGALLLRDGIVDHAADNPAWKVFPASPMLNYSTTDTRELLCWNITPSVPGCQQAVANSASPAPWDVDAELGTPWFLTRGNNARATHKWFSNVGNQQGTDYAASATRDYVYPWTNQWYEERCNPAAFTSPELNDIDAARANLHAMHNRMHDWSYNLGFTELTFNAQAFNFGRGGVGNDPEHGTAQAGGVVGEPPGFQSRDNANQFSPFDGIVPVTNMFLWQPVPASFYGPCVDGDYDMSVIAHEYGHLISNRMVAGPNANLSGDQAGGMGESWSDLDAAEFLNSQALVPLADENPFAVGAYVTGDKVAGIRNYGMNMSPLNYSDVGYDFACNQAGVCIRRSQVHADGEIWSATNYDIRQALIEAYNDSFPADDLALQQACVAGDVPVTECPGNRRWMQLVFDGWLLMASGAVSMVDARDAMLAADMIRFAGANQALLWNTFARRGLGTFCGQRRHERFRPDAELRVSSRRQCHGDLQSRRRGGGLSGAAVRRPLRGGGHGNRGHRPGYATRGHVQHRPRHLRVRRTRERLRFEAVHLLVQPGAGTRHAGHHVP
jgi:extracellular elastinolytic metalloproteinase